MKRLTRLWTYLAIMLLAAFQAAAQINADQVLRIGRNALYFEDYILSIQYFNQVIKAKPTWAEPYFYRSVAKINLEDYKGAETDASEAIERNPFIIDAYQVRGVARQNMRDFEGAIDDYRHGLELKPDDKVFYMNSAVCHSELRHFETADSCFSWVLKTDSKNDKAYLGLAHLNLVRKDTTTALENLSKSIELSKNNASAYVMRAEILMRSKQDYENALADMDEAIKLEPHYAGYFINRAYMKYNLDDYFGAMADYDYAIGLDADNREGHFNRALLLAEVGENNKAIDDFSFVLKNEPENFMALYNRAMLYFKTGQYKKAVADYTGVLKKYPQFEAGYMARGEARRRMGDRNGGEADYNTAMALFKKKHTHTSNFNPAETEAKKMVKDAEEQRRLIESGEFTEQPESEEDIMNKFNTLLTVAPENPIKPEYANRQRGRIQNSNVEVSPEPMFLMSYYSLDNKLNGNTYYLREVAELNDTRLLPKSLTIVCGDRSLTEDDIKRHFESVEYYNGVLTTSQPRAVDYFARAMDYLMLRNHESAIADATRAIELNPDFILAHFLLADACYLKYKMTLTQQPDADDKANTVAKGMLKGRESAALLREVITHLDDVIKFSSSNPYAHYDKGFIYMEMGDYTSAISSYTKSLELKPDFAQAYYNRGLLYLRMGNKDKGVSDLSKAGELGILPSYNVIKRMNN